MMKRSAIKSAYLKIQASDEFKKRIVSLLQKNVSKKASNCIRRFIPITVVFVMAFGLITVFSLFKHGYTSSQNVITIPKIDLSKDTQNSNAIMQEFVEYNGRVYVKTGTDIDIQSARKLIVEKLGNARGNISEYGSQHTSDTGFNSNIPGDVYSVEGYDSNFRIMLLSKDVGGERAIFLECYNCITITNGRDVLGKLKLQGNVMKFTYMHFGDWNIPVYDITDSKMSSKFIDALNDTTPFLYDKIPGGLPFGKKNLIRYIAIKLKDGSVIKLALTKDGYIMYGNCPVVFKMNNGVFSKLWNRLDETKDKATGY